MSKTFHVLVTGTQLAETAVAKLKAIGAEITMMAGKVTEERLHEAFAERAPDAILLRGNPPLGAALFATAPTLRVIAKHGAGVDSVDLSAATDHGICVMIAGDTNAMPVAEHTMAMILALGRELVTLDRDVHAGRWARGAFMGREIAGRTLGLIGLGKIGRRVAAMAPVFGLKVLALGRSPGSIDPMLATEVDSLEALLAQSDIVSLHTPLTEATRNLIDSQALSLMRPGALLINTGRGALVDEAALAEALTSGRLAGAAVDTLAEEPPSPDNPLLKAPNLIITPHIAAQTDAAIARMGEAAADNIAAVLTGGTFDEANVVNRAILAKVL